MNQSLAKHYFEDSIASLRAYKKLAEKALDQLSEDEFFITLDEEANSIAVIIKHMAGNMLSRWTDFLTSDGEKRDRNRDMEFVIEPKTGGQDILTYWESRWQRVFDTLRITKRRGSGKEGQDSRRRAHRGAGDQSSVNALLLSHRPDSFPGKAFPIIGVEVAQYSAEQVD